MEEHLKKGLFFALVTPVVLLILNAIAWTGVGYAAVISRAVLTPLTWVWDLLGISGCQAMGHIATIVLSIPVYYCVIGFLVGFLFSILIEIVPKIIEGIRHSKQRPNN